jgi:ABC-type nitrate/sulfonate/bicarbonate transport system substrate-binding protein
LTALHEIRGLNLGVAITLAVFVAACSSGSPAGSPTVASSEKDPSEVNIGTGGDSTFSYLPLYIADSKGFLTDELKPLGVTYKITTYNASPDVTKALLSGQVEYAADFSTTVLSAQVESSTPMKLLDVFLNGDTNIVLSRKGLSTNIKDLAGEKWGITAFGAGNNITALMLAKSVGIASDQLQLVALGSANAYAPALEAGQVGVVFAGEPGAEQLISSGTGQLVMDFNDPKVGQQIYGGAYYTAGMAATSDYVTAHPKLTAAVNRALVRAMDWTQQNLNNPDQVKGAVPPKMQVETIAAILKRLGPNLSKDGTIDPSGVQNTITAMKTAGLMDSSQNLDLGALVYKS